MLVIYADGGRRDATAIPTRTGDKPTENFVGDGTTENGRGRGTEKVMHVYNHKHLITSASNT
jgi:hypothetical protein